MNNPHRPVTAAEIAELLTRLRTLRTPAQGGDPAEHAAFLTAKADLLTRIADEHADDQPPCQHATHARHVAAHARFAAAHARTLAETARTNPKDTQ
jgi:hypothetical protein